MKTSSMSRDSAAVTFNGLSNSIIVLPCTGVDAARARIDVGELSDPKLHSVTSGYVCECNVHAIKVTWYIIMYNIFNANYNGPIAIVENI